MAEICESRCGRHPNAEPYLLQNTQPNAHYGKWLCTECDKFIKHARTPKTNVELLQRQSDIEDRIVESGSLTKAQVAALCKLYSVPHLKLLQQTQYDALMNSCN